MSNNSVDGAEGVGEVVMMTVKASDIGALLESDAGGISGSREDGPWSPERPERSIVWC